MSYWRMLFEWETMKNSELASRMKATYIGVYLFSIFLRDM